MMKRFAASRLFSLPLVKPLPASGFLGTNGSRVLPINHTSCVVGVRGRLRRPRNSLFVARCAGFATAPSHKEWILEGECPPNLPSQLYYISSPLAHNIR